MCPVKNGGITQDLINTLCVGVFINLIAQKKLMRTRIRSPYGMSQHFLKIWDLPFITTSIQHQKNLLIDTHHEPMAGIRILKRQWRLCSMPPSWKMWVPSIWWVTYWDMFHSFELYPSILKLKSLKIFKHSECMSLLGLVPAENVLKRPSPSFVRMLSAIINRAKLLVHKNKTL